MARGAHQRGVASLLVCLVLWLLLTESGIQWVHGMVGTVMASTDDVVQQPQPPPQPSSEAEDERQEMFELISEHCLPKLVCELYAKNPPASPSVQASLTESEKALISLIGASSLSSVKPSKYHYAAHFGQLIQGLEGQGCHFMYPSCPFSGQDVQQIARKVALT